MTRFNRICKEIGAELDRSIELHGEFTSARAGHSIIEEEYDEFWEAIKVDDIPHAVIEAKQLAAMAIKFILLCG